MLDEVRCVSANDCLRISYRILCQDQELEACPPGETVEYQMGAGHWPDIIEQAMLGKAESARLNIKLAAADNAFGRPNPERVIELDRQDFKTEPEPGDLIEFKLHNGETVEGQVLLVFGDTIQLDFNHPYVGRDLHIEIVIQSIL